MSFNGIEINNSLSELLSSWHKWARGYQHVGDISPSPTFRVCKSSRQWDTVDEIISGDIENSQMEALDAIIMAMSAVHRTALQIQARNLCTGYSVWTSARLPQDLEQRAMVLAEARAALTGKLKSAGIL